MIYRGFNIGAAPMFPGYVPAIVWPKDMEATPLWPRYFLFIKKFRWDTPEEARDVGKYYVDKCIARNKGEIAYIYRIFIRGEM